jgi:PilZ domain
LPPQRSAKRIVSIWEANVSERRRLQRSRVYLGASIAYDNRRATLDCVVRNLTAEGAMIATANSASVPEVFNLLVPAKSLSFLGRAVWRTEERMGVKFLDRDLGKPPVPLDLVRRLKACEAEREALRQRVAQLNEPG